MGSGLSVWYALAAGGFKRLSSEKARWVPALGGSYSLPYRLHAWPIRFGARAWPASAAMTRIDAFDIRSGTAIAAQWTELVRQLPNEFNRMWLLQHGGKV
jgi:hypothetical protein